MASVPDTEFFGRTEPADGSSTPAPVARRVRLSREELLARVDVVALFAELLPGFEGKVNGSPETKFRCPLHEDMHASANVNRETGLWRCHGCGAKGSPIDMVMQIRGCSIAEAFAFLEERAGIAPVPSRGSRPKDWRPILPVPPDAAPMTLRHPKHGEASASWAYRSPAGELLGYVLRFDYRGSDGARAKDVMPVTFCEGAEGRRSWRFKGFTEPRPLYGLDRLAARPDVEVLVVEGEKTADAARALFPELVAIAWPGGAQAPDKSDWSPLKGRRVVLWPDADAPGRTAMQEAARCAMRAGAASAAIVPVPDGVPRGWDLADQVPEGVDVRELLAAAAAMDREGAGPEDPRPAITITTEMMQVTDAAQQALFDKPELGVYQRAGLLVRVVRDSTDMPKIPGLRRPEGAEAIAELPAARLHELMAAAARWIRHDARTNAAKPALPPRWTVEGLQKRGAWPFPYLSAVIGAPTIREDGTLLLERGYDRATGLLLESADVCKTIPEAPGREDAAEALAQLAEPFGDFPFLSLEDLAVVLASILTILGRHAIDGPVPMFAFLAPTPGTGKSLAADVVSIITTGRAAARMTAPKEDDELRKRLLALALEGAPIVLLDNVTGILRSDSLAAALTAMTWTDRVMGTNTKMQTVPLRCVWLLSGNNVSFAGDLGRRVLVAGLDPKVEHPEDRSGFTYPDLTGWVLSHRARFVTAGLTVLRAYHLAGRPAHGKPLKGSFEKWDRLVRGALIWAGAGDPTATTERIRAEGDADLDTLREALREWEEAFGAEPRTVAAALDRARGRPPLAGALAELAGVPVGQLDSRSLGYRLRGAAGRIVAGRRLERLSARSNLGVQWRLVKDQTQ